MINSICVRLGWARLPVDFSTYIFLHNARFYLLRAYLIAWPADVVSAKIGIRKCMFGRRAIIWDCKIAKIVGISKLRKTYNR